MSTARWSFTAPVVQPARGHSTLLASTISLMLLILSLATFPFQEAQADEGMGEGGGGSAAAVALGWVAIASGALGNVPFLLYIRVKKTSVSLLGGGHEMTRGLAVQHPIVLNFHMAMNLIGFAAGVAHGITLLRGLDAISLSLAIVMTVLVTSGLVLRFSSLNIRNFAKIMHGQMVLSGLLVALVALHVISMTGFD